MHAKSPSSRTRSRSSSDSSSDEAVIELPPVVRNRGGSSSTRQRAPSSVGSGSVGAGVASAAGSSDVSAASATRRGRLIKKPIRLEEQALGRQTLPGRNGRADAPSKLAVRTAAPGQAQPGAAAGAAAGASSAGGKSGGQARGKGRAAVEEPAAAAGGAERCVARLGSAASSDRVETRTRNVAQSADSSNSNGGVETNQGLSSVDVAPSSAAAGPVVRMPLPLERRTVGVTPQGGRGAVRERDRMAVPDPPPERPTGGLGSAPDDTIKEYRRAFDDVREGTVSLIEAVDNSTARPKNEPYLLTHPSLEHRTRPTAVVAVRRKYATP